MHSRQLLLVEEMSLVMPGQKMELVALAVMPLMPWWAACKASRQVCRRESGTTILSPRHTTPSTQVMSLILPL